MREQHPIPAIALSAFQLAKQQYGQMIEQLAKQALASANLVPEDGWKVDVDNMVAFREVADTASAEPSVPQLME